MKRFDVYVPVSGWDVYSVEAENVEEAREIVASGEVEECDFLPDSDGRTWEVEEV